MNRNPILTIPMSEHIKNWSSKVNVYGNNIPSSVPQRLMQSQQQDFHVNGEICWAESTVTTNGGNFRNYEETQETLK